MHRSPAGRIRQSSSATKPSIVFVSILVLVLVVLEFVLVLVLVQVLVLVIVLVLMCWVSVVAGLLLALATWGGAQVYTSSSNINSNSKGLRIKRGSFDPIPSTRSLSHPDYSHRIGNGPGGEVSATIAARLSRILRARPGTGAALRRRRRRRRRRRLERG